MKLDEKQATKILTKAIELQNADRGKPEARGMSEEELFIAAGELGIERHYIEQALLSVGTSHISRDRGFLGAPTFLSHSICTLFSPTDEDLKELVPIMGSITGVSGSGWVYKGRLEWQSDAFHTQISGWRLQIAIARTDAGTKIDVSASMVGVAGGIFGGFMGGFGLGGIGTGIGLSASGAVSTLSGAGITLGILLGSYCLARMIFSFVTKTTAKRIETICRRLDQIISKNDPRQAQTS